VITLDLRAAIARAASDMGFGPPAADPKLRPAGRPGAFATPLAFTLAQLQGPPQPRAQAPATETQPRRLAGPAHGQPASIARALASRLQAESFITRAMVTGNGYVTITITEEALAAVAARVISAGPACAQSDILIGVTVPAPPPRAAADWAHAATWEEAKAALAAQLTPRLATAAGATVISAFHPQRSGVPRPVPPRLAGAGPAGPGEPAGDGAGSRERAAQVPGEWHAGGPPAGPVAEAIAFAGVDAVRFALARAVPGGKAAPEVASVARHVPGNPAYAVRYAHARAASGLRWAAALGNPGESAQPCLPANPADWALLDALCWLPERVAGAARRGRPDEFARYLESLASATITAMPFVGYEHSVADKGSVADKPGAGYEHGAGNQHSADPADGERLALTRALATAARAGLAAGLGLLGVSAPEDL
jgi:arginyl-tRNA synthetase